MIKALLVDSSTGESVLIKDMPIGRVLAIASPGQIDGHFKAVTIAAAGTATIADPTGEGAIVLTDLIVTTEKKTNGTLTVRFTDDTNTINILVIDLNDAPVNIAIPFAGRWQGWRSARLEYVSVQDFDGCIACGYMKICKELALTYTEWDAAR